MNEFNTWLERELLERNWSQAELARRARIARSSISMLLSQDRQPGPDLCRGIARAFNLPEETVFRRAGLIASRPQSSPLLDRANHLLSQLTEDKQQEMLEYIEFIYER